MEKTLKAYEVRDSDEGNCCIEFAPSSVVARRDGANELNTDFESVESCTRAPWADQYAPGPVPIGPMLAQGWWHDCSGCGCTINSDGRQGEEHEDREDEFDPQGNDTTGVYCSPTCQQREWARRRAREALEQAAIEAAALKWSDAFGITGHEHSVREGGRYTDRTQWVACFRLPGLQYGITWAVGEETVSVSQCDVEAWNARKAQQEVTHA